MGKKRYEVRGMMEWHPEFAVGRTKVRVSFTGGHLCGGGVTPAVFETSDPVLQAVIEQSEAFRSKRIKLAPGCRPSMGTVLSNSQPLPKPVATAAKPKQECHPLRMVFKNLADASELLHYDKGIPMSLLMDKGACIREGKKMGLEIVFEP